MGVGRLVLGTVKYLVSAESRMAYRAHLTDGRTTRKQALVNLGLPKAQRDAIIFSERTSVGRFLILHHPEYFNANTVLAGSHLIDPYQLVSCDPRPRRSDLDLRVDQEHIRFSVLCYREVAKIGKLFIASMKDKLKPEAIQAMGRQIAEAERNAAYLELLASGGGIEAGQDALKIQRSMRWEAGHLAPQHLIDPLSG